MEVMENRIEIIGSDNKIILLIVNWEFTYRIRRKLYSLPSVPVLFARLTFSDQHLQIWFVNYL